MQASQHVQKQARMHGHLIPWHQIDHTEGHMEYCSDCWDLQPIVLVVLPGTVRTVNEKLCHPLGIKHVASVELRVVLLMRNSSPLLRIYVA